MTTLFYIARKSGALRNGNERGSFRYHAVPISDDAPLCGQRPAISWRTEEGAAVTCPACLKALQGIEGASFVSGTPESVAF